MHRISRISLATGLVLATAFPLHARQAAPDAQAAHDPATATAANPAIATASKLLDSMDAGDFDAATADFNAQMKAALGTTQLAGVQLQLEAAGPVQARSEPTVTTQQGHTVLVYRIQREQATIDATVTIDGDGKVAGLFFAPATP